MTMTGVDVATLEPLTHQEAMRCQAIELGRTLTLLRSLDGTSWTARTDCPAWDIRAMYQHVLGACEAGASLGENIRQLRRARAYRKRHGGPLEAALSAVQVRERADLSPAEIICRLAAVAPRTVRGRTRIPALVRDHARLRVDGPVQESWKLGYLIDTIYLRDLWMHRIDAARAAGRPPELSAGHDGRIVADIVAEWARRHGKPFILQLTDPAGGAYVCDPGPGQPDAQHLSLGAVEFCRTLAGRAPATGLLATTVPF
jgi:uncharacterized protein (TIGR03083 family)